MPAPKKHKKRPSTSRQYARAGWTPKVTLTMSDATRARLEALGTHYGVDGLSATIGFLAKQAADAIGLTEIPK